MVGEKEEMWSDLGLVGPCQNSSFTLSDMESYWRVTNEWSAAIRLIFNRIMLAVVLRADCGRRSKDRKREMH